MNMCFCGKTTQRSWDLYAVSRSGLHWLCSPSQIIEPRPHSAGRNLEIASAGASEPPGQLMEAQIPGLQSQDSDSVGLGWHWRSCFSSKLPKHECCRYRHPTWVSLAYDNLVLRWVSKHFLKGQLVTILGFAGRTVCAATVQFCRCSW